MQNEPRGLKGALTGLDRFRFFIENQINNIPIENSQMIQDINSKLDGEPDIDAIRATMSKISDNEVRRSEYQRFLNSTENMIKYFDQYFG